MSVLRAFIVVTLSAAFFLTSGIAVLWPYTTAYTGYHPGPLGTAPDGQQSVVDAESPAYNAGIRTGDTVGCVTLRDGEILFPAFQPAQYESDPIHACVTRDGVRRDVSFVAKAGPTVTSTYGNFGLAALRMVIFAVFLIVGALLVIVRPGRMTWLFFAYCLGTQPTAVMADAWTNLSPLGYALVVQSSWVFTSVGSAFLLLFALVVPDERAPRGWRSWMSAAGWIVVAAIATIELYWLWRGTTYIWLVRAAAPQMMRGALTLLVLLVTVVRLVTMRGEARARFAWVAFAIIIGVVANYLRLGLNNAIANFGGMLTIVMPLAMLYAILRRHVIDVRFVISRTVVFAVITTAVVGIIAVVDWATSQYLSQMRVALAIDAAITIALGVVLHRSYNRIENVADFYIFRKKHEAEVYVKRLARSLLSSEREETIDRALVADPYEKLDLTMAALFRNAGKVYVVQTVAGWRATCELTFDHDNDLVRFLIAERKRLQLDSLRKDVAQAFRDAGASPVVAMPVFDGEALFGFAVYGLHRDGTRLDPDELDALENLCDTAAQAYIRVENLQYRRMLAHGSPTPNAPKAL